MINGFVGSVQPYRKFKDEICLMAYEGYEMKNPKTKFAANYTIMQQFLHK